MTVATALVLMGTTVTAKAASLIRPTAVGISQDKDNSLVLRHASELSGKSDLSMAEHGSHGSHGSHASHASSSK